MFRGEGILGGTCKERLAHVRPVKNMFAQKHDKIPHVVVYDANMSLRHWEKAFSKESPVLGGCELALGTEEVWNAKTKREQPIHLCTILIPSAVVNHIL